MSVRFAGRVATMNVFAERDVTPTRSVSVPEFVNVTVPVVVPAMDPSATLVLSEVSSAREREPLTRITRRSLHGSKITTMESTSGPSAIGVHTTLNETGCPGVSPWPTAKVVVNVEPVVTLATVAEPVPSNVTCVVRVVDAEASHAENSPKSTEAGVVKAMPFFCAVNVTGKLTVHGSATSVAVCENAPVAAGLIVTRTFCVDRAAMVSGPAGEKITSAVEGSETVTPTLDVLLIVIVVSRSISQPESVPISIDDGVAVTVTSDVIALRFTLSVSEHEPDVNGNLATVVNVPAPDGEYWKTTFLSSPGLMLTDVVGDTRTNGALTMPA